MKFRDNVAAFSTAMTALSLEFFLLLVLGAGEFRSDLPLERDRFMLLGQTYLLGACLVTYLAGRYFVKPLQSILEGVAEFSKGHLRHRIPPSRVKELDQLSQQLNGMAARLLELDSMKNDFVANVSHELRSPLAAMESYVALLLRDPVAEQARGNLLRLQENLARLRHLVEDLLDISQIEARQAQVQPEAVSLSEIARDVCALFSAQCSARRITVKLDIPKSLPKAHADPARVRQILINLVDNAMKYNRAGGEIALSASPERKRLLVSVQDTGMGIAPEHLENIFERFHRLPPASPEAARIKGAGLGLSISRGLAQLMGGDITVASAHDKGSTFTLSLPSREL